MKKPLKNLLASLASPGPSLQVLDEAEDETAAKVVESDEEFGLVGAPAARKSNWDASVDSRYKGRTTSRKKLADDDDVPGVDDDDEDGEEEDYEDDEDGAAEEDSDVDDEDGGERREHPVARGSKSANVGASYDVVSTSGESGSSDEDDYDEGGEVEAEDESDADSDREEEVNLTRSSANGKARTPSKRDDEATEGDDDEEDDGDDDDDDDDFDDGEGHFGSQGDEEGSAPSTNVFSKGESLSSEVQKGQAVKRQLEEWDMFLQWRIHLQKLQHAINQTPDWKTHPEFVEAGDKEFKQSLTKAMNSVKQLLVALVNLRELRSSSSGEGKAVRAQDDDEEVPSSDEEIPSSEAEGDDDSEGGDPDAAPKSEKSASAPKQKSNSVARTNLSLEQLDEMRRASFAASKSYRESVVQEWSDKTRLLARTSKADRGFSAFDQSALQQIRHILADRPRLLKRTRTQRSSYQILGKRKASSSEIEIPTATGSDEVCDPEIFDDDDFYQNLLREFIEKRMSTDGNTNLIGSQWLEMQNLRKKLKKQRLDRESKDRRMKYEVHQKMVSFMAPRLPPMDSLNDEARNELFSCLFGKNSARDGLVAQAEED